MAGTICALAVGAFTLAACASDPASTTTSPASDPTPQVADGRLTAPISFTSGQLVLKSPGGRSPVTSSDAAVTAFKDTGLYSAELSGRTPETFLASLTSYGASDTISADGHLLPDQADRLVWIVYFHGVPSMPVGPARPDGTSTAAPVEKDILSVTDAMTGAMRGVETATADPHVRNLDEGPLVHPGK